MHSQMRADKYPEEFLLPAEERRRILLAIPREAWDWQNTPHEPFDADSAKNGFCQKNQFMTDFHSLLAPIVFQLQTFAG